MVTIRIPGPTQRTTSNVIGVAGVVGLVVTVGALAGSWWWSLGLASAVLVALSWVGHREAELVELAAAKSRTGPAAATTAPPAAPAASAANQGG